MQWLTNVSYDNKFPLNSCFYACGMVIIRFLMLLFLSYGIDCAAP